jgi:hypothetical protein
MIICISILTSVVVTGGYFYTLNQLYYRITFTNGQKMKNTDVFLVPEKVILSSKNNTICSYMM